jgi:MFS transporter, FSR family, fosmidomycin resistance protein
VTAGEGAKAVSETEPVGTASLEGEAFETERVLTIAAGHWIHDSYTAFLAPLLIVFKQNLGLSNTEAGLLSVFMQEASLVQPIIGGLADRFSARYFVVLAPAVTGVVMSLLGLAPNYLTLAILLTIVGFSSACIHAVGPVMTGNVSGPKLGLGMSLWMVGGEAGRFVGPLVIGTAIPLLTLERTPWLMVGGLGPAVPYPERREGPHGRCESERRFSTRGVAGKRQAGSDVGGLHCGARFHECRAGYVSTDNAA